MKIEIIHTEIAIQKNVIKETNIPYTNPEMVAKFMGFCKDYSQEAFHVLTVNTKNQIIGKHLVTLGTVNSSLVHPRETFRVAILDGASGIFLAHNHPSGDPTPSVEDIKITKQLIGAGDIVGIKVLDHLIIGNDGTEKPCFHSLRESGLVNFS